MILGIISTVIAGILIVGIAGFALWKLWQKNSKHDGDESSASMDSMPAETVTHLKTESQAITEDNPLYNATNDEGDDPFGKDFEEDNPNADLTSTVIV